MSGDITREKSVAFWQYNRVKVNNVYIDIDILEHNDSIRINKRIIRHKNEDEIEFRSWFDRRNRLSSEHYSLNLDMILYKSKEEDKVNGNISRFEVKSEVKGNPKYYSSKIPLSQMVIDLRNIYDQLDAAIRNPKISYGTIKDMVYKVLLKNYGKEVEPELSRIFEKSLEQILSERKVNNKNIWKHIDIAIIKRVNYIDKDEEIIQVKYWSNRRSYLGDSGYLLSLDMYTYKSRKKGKVEGYINELEVKGDLGYFLTYRWPLGDMNSEFYYYLLSRVITEPMESIPEIYLGIIAQQLSKEVFRKDLF